MPPDRFESYAELAAEFVEGEDFIVRCKNRNSPIAIIAPHGGTIEFMTTELAQEIADNRFSFYSLVGLKVRPHHEMHVTSHKFDEPRCVDLISKCESVIAIHGRKNSGDRRRIFLGGLDRSLKKSISDELERSGFQTLLSGHKFPAKRSSNICNRGATKKGCQIELPATLRGRLRDDEALLKKFVSAVQKAIEGPPSS